MLLLKFHLSNWITIPRFPSKKSGIRQVGFVPPPPSPSTGVGILTELFLRVLFVVFWQATFHVGVVVRLTFSVWTFSRKFLGSLCEMDWCWTYLEPASHAPKNILLMHFSAFPRCTLDFSFVIGRARSLVWKSAGLKALASCWTQMWRCLRKAYRSFGCMSPSSGNVWCHGTMFQTPASD